MSDSTEEAATSSAPAPTPLKKVNRKVIAAVIGGVLAVVGVVTFVSVITQPTAITRAADACAGAEPLDALFEELRASESPQPDSETTPESEEGGEFDDLFDGVVSVQDDGKTLIVNTKSTDDDPVGVTGLALDCVYEQLGVPSHISERIGQTRALDGRQDGAWGDYTASWSYHPDSGANVIIVRN